MGVRLEDAEAVIVVEGEDLNRIGRQNSGVKKYKRRPFHYGGAGYDPTARRQSILQIESRAFQSPPSV
jgi:hypothetical protein